LKFVLVHGAWGGSWMWARLAQLLRTQGHEVFTPSMTGIGERAHLASADVDLSLHTKDILQVIEYERLCDFVLVGHSYGGMVVTGVADRVADKVRTLVYLDAFVPRNGEALLDLARPEMRAAIQDLKDSIPPLPPQRQGMTDPQEIAWVEGRRDPQPIGTFKEKVSLKGNYRGKKTYIFCSGYSPTSFSGFATAAKADKSWQYHELPTHHYPQISMPRELAALLTAGAVS
jgi:pimeloyl-ACP methyl ester carboxylesterase